MENLDYIDNYFNGEKTAIKEKEFENRLLNDASFAEEVAFYIAANKAIKEELQNDKKETFRELYQEQKLLKKKTAPVRIIWRLVAAASVAAIVIVATWLMTNNETAQQYANKYIDEHMKTLGVTMSAAQDSMQHALSIYNQGKLQEALKLFEEIAKNNDNNSEAKKYAGIACLRMEKYEAALQYFGKLSLQTGLYSNPGKLYEVITLMKRNKTGDNVEARKLMQQIIDNNLEGKEQAAKWLKKIK